MAKNTYLQRMQLQHRKDNGKAAFIARQQTLDKVVIALGQYGLNPEELHKFAEIFFDVENEFCDEVITDGKSDKKLEYAKEVIDRAIKQYVLPEDFTPYDERYLI